MRPANEVYLVVENVHAQYDTAKMLYLERGRTISQLQLHFAEMYINNGRLFVGEKKVERLSDIIKKYELSELWK